MMASGSAINAACIASIWAVPAVFASGGWLAFAFFCAYLIFGNAAPLLR